MRTVDRPPTLADSRAVSDRPAAWIAVIVPAVLWVVLFVATATSAAASGAGMSDDNRPIGFFMLAALGAGGWLIGTAGMFVVVRPPERLPRIIRLFAVQVVYGPAAVASVAAEVPLSTGSDGLSILHLLWLAIVVFPVLTFLGPFLLGYLLQPAVYRPAEYAAVLAMGVVVVGWTAWLLRRAPSARP
jgi:hypothetical protein